MRGTSSHSALQVVVIGGSLAGVRAAVALRELGFSGRLTLVDAELVDPYDRPPLSKGFLAQALTGADIRLGDASELDATRLRGRRAVGASMTERLVDLDDGTSVRFDGLIIAFAGHAIDEARRRGNVAGIRTVPIAAVALIRRTL